MAYLAEFFDLLLVLVAVAYWRHRLLQDLCVPMLATDYPGVYDIDHYYASQKFTGL